MDGAHPRLGAGIPPSVAPKARIFRLLGGGERALTPATGVRCSPSGLTAAPRDAFRAQFDPGGLPLHPASVSMGPGPAAVAWRSGPGGGRTARGATPPPPS